MGWGAHPHDSHAGVWQARLRHAHTRTHTEFNPPALPLATHARPRPAHLRLLPLSDWGEDGYWRLVKGVNHCGVANFAQTSVVKPVRR